MKKNLRNAKKPALALRIEHIRTLTSAQLESVAGGVVPNPTDPSGGATCTCVSVKKIQCA